MRCLLAAVGSRGDVEPMVLLAGALAARGHDVVLCLDPGHHQERRDVPRVTRTALGDLDAAALAGIVARALTAAPAERSREALRGFFGRRRKALARRMQELASGTFDLVVVSEWLLFSDGATLRWSTPTAVVVNTPGAREHFIDLGRVPCLRLAALSSVFGGRGDAEVESSWIFTGFWIKRTAGALDCRTEEFLAAGPPPFFLTMGSMVGFDAAALATAFVEGARGAGRRAIVQRGWAGLPAPPAPDVLAVDDVDYAALFPRCAAIFCHGGTGTTAHALHAGRPVAFLPLVGDQCLWAENLMQMGNAVGRLDPFAPRADLFFALMQRAVDDPGPARKASALAAKMRGEDGLAAACRALEGTS